MDRLRCGVIVTTEFTTFLKEWWSQDAAQQKERVPSLDFVHCKEGPRAGESWVTLTWIPTKKLPEHECFEVGGVPLHLPKQSQRGLKWRCLDAREGKLVVIGGE
jgi:hypothetical protein